MHILGDGGDDGAGQITGIASWGKCPGEQGDG
jgi:hypothetical protein